MKMEQTESSETSAYKIQMPGNYPEESSLINVTPGYYMQTRQGNDHISSLDIETISITDTLIPCIAL